MDPLLTILFDSPELLVVNKPAGLVCHPTKGDAFSSLISRARLHLGPGAHPQLINRLDRETSGVVVIARDAETARSLRRMWEARRVHKEYLAIVHGWPGQDAGTVQAPLGPDEHSRVAIKDCVRPDGASAITHFKVMGRFTRRRHAASGTPGEETPFALIQATPETGRKHQIRIHLSSIGHPIVGDKIYGPDEDCYLALVENRLTDSQRRMLILPHQALHASAVAFAWKENLTRFEAAPESWFAEFLPENLRNPPPAAAATFQKQILNSQTTCGSNL